MKEKRVCPKCGYSNPHNRVKCKKCKTVLSKEPAPNVKKANEPVARSEKQLPQIVDSFMTMVGLAGFALFFCAIIGLYLGYTLGSEIRRVKNAQTSLPAPSTASKSIDLVLSGVLGGQTPAGSEMLDSDARQIGLVIYAVEEWEVTTRKTGLGWKNSDGRWVVKRTVVPTEITLGEEIIPTKTSNKMELNQEQVISDILVQGDGELFQGVQDGSLRLAGFRPGAEVTVFGKYEASYLVIEHVFGGSQSSFQSYLKKNASETVRISWLLMTLGGVLIAARQLVQRRKFNKNP